MTRMKNYSVIALSLLIGVIIGIAQNNIGLWVSLGLAIGVAIDYKMKSGSSEKNIDKAKPKIFDGKGHNKR